MKHVVLAGAVRTPIGRFGGSLAETSAAQLGTAVVAEALRRAGIDGAVVDEVILGQVLQAGCGQNIARQASVGAGLPLGIPAITVNQVCGSSLAAINLAAAQVLSGQADVVAVGGVENMSQAPYLLSKARFGYRLNDGQLVDSMFSEGLNDTFNQYPMGITAENLAERFGISREDQDAYAATSQQRAAAAQQADRFEAEILPLEIRQGREKTLFQADESIRPNSTAEGLARLRPAFKPDGTVTAGNASTINDGAAALVVLSRERAKELGVNPMATWVGGTSAGVEPELMGRGPVASTQKLLRRTGIGVNDIARIELNEAFAAQALCVIRQLNLNQEITNPNGGAIALGHPLGCSGARVLVTLLHELQRSGGGLGLASLCIGGGMGVSTLVRAES
ncbi:MAG: acetyl-CoA C-acetyltransferase [Propionibacteriaceae bacterium]|nr:acetyl-CoA C-acetyltransferase [Propionibacteriaceae bacterium]